MHIIAPPFSCCLFVLLLCFGGTNATFARADTELSKTIDCSEIDLKAVIDPTKSTAENLEILSQQFFNSVNTVNHCDRDEVNDTGTDADSGDTGEAGPGARDDNTGAANNQSEGADTNATAEPSDSLAGTGIDTQEDMPPETALSVPSDLTGTTPETIPETAPEKSVASSKPVNENQQPGSTQEDPDNSATGLNNGTPIVELDNGKLPDDIPKQDNDSVFEAQIRAAAIAETDPNIKKNLWNEYRRYKGIPEEK